MQDNYQLILFNARFSDSPIGFAAICPMFIHNFLFNSNNIVYCNCELGLMNPEPFRYGLNLRVGGKVLVITLSIVRELTQNFDGSDFQR